MLRLLTASASPFANKARMAAHHAGIGVEPVAVTPAELPAELIAANPLGKIPCLVLENGTGLFDSRPITRYLDRVSGGKLYPNGDEALTAAERYEALCDGIGDCAVAWQYEQRLRPEEKVHKPWQDLQWSKVQRGLTEAAKDLPAMGEKLDITGIALAATLGYLDLRFAGQWADGHDGLIKWNGEFDAQHPDLAALKPSA